MISLQYWYYYEDKFGSDINKLYLHFQRYIFRSIYSKVKLSTIQATSSGSPQLAVPRQTYLSPLYAEAVKVVSLIFWTLYNHLIVFLLAFVPSFRAITSFDTISKFVPIPWRKPNITELAIEISATIRRSIKMWDTIWSPPGYHVEADVRKISSVVIIFKCR